MDMQTEDIAKIYLCKSKIWKIASLTEVEDNLQ